MYLNRLSRIVHRPGLAGQPGRKLHNTTHRRSYDDTVRNLVVSPETRVVVQGLTGKQATFDTKQSLEYGTKIVGGVRPGKEGEHLGLPYFGTMKKVKEELKPDATLVYVAAPFAAGAVEEAIEAEVPLIVAVAEHIPLHDMLRVQSMLRTQSRSRLVGANSPGMTSTHARCRLGFQPIPFFKAGCVSIVAKSGTLSYETVASTSAAGLGQSYVIGMGGDALPGTDFVDALKVFEEDENTEGIILVGEVGGFSEEKAAEWIKDYRKRVKEPKPIMALIAGLNAVPERVMGHDGAFAAPGEQHARDKYRALQEAGVVLTDHPSKFGNTMKSLLERRVSTKAPSQRRSLHTYHRPRVLAQRVRSQKRHLNLSSSQSIEFLSKDFPLHPNKTPASAHFVISVAPDRSFFQPRIHIRRTPYHPPTNHSTGIASSKILFNLSDSSETITAASRPILENFYPEEEKEKSKGLAELITKLATIWRDNEGSFFKIEVGPSEGRMAIVDADIRFDDWAFRMGGRHKDIHELRDKSLEIESEVEAEKDGIVYVQLPGNGKVGTLVNGAGLAMNTTDALAIQGHPAANFLDTGGKATAKTVSASFAAVLSDPRVKAIYVNIFGGLTKCEMIAEGIVLAFKERGIQEKGIGVVVRLRGTNEAEGRKVLQDSGLGIVAVEDFFEGIKEVGKLIEQAE